MSETSFEWDEIKNKENQRKHGVSFYEAQYAFMDKRRVIAEDLNHSQDEKRYYCFGLNEAGTGILTVRFTYRSGFIRIIGEKLRRSMSKVIKYSDEPIGDLKLVTDFFPPPEKLSLKKENTKVTISLSSESVVYFKEVAKKHRKYSANPSLT
jgi:hypothetical protein